MSICIYFIKYGTWYWSVRMEDGRYRNGVVENGSSDNAWEAAKLASIELGMETSEE